MSKDNTGNLAPTNHVCPNCGYCDHCGRGGQRVYPQPVYPYYGHPYWSVILPFEPRYGTGDFPSYTTVTCNTTTVPGDTGPVTIPGSYC